MSKIYDNYIKEFSDFLDEYDKGIMGPGKIASIGCRFTQYMAECGKEQFGREVLYNIQHRDIINGNDPQTGKPFSSVKADVLADATEEYKNYKEAKNDYESISQMVAALARLQKASMAEMGLANV